MPSSVLLPASEVEAIGSIRASMPTRGAIFGQASARLTARVTATAGLRYTHEGKTIDNSGGLYTIDAQATLLPDSSYAYTDAISDDAWTPKFGAEMRVSENVMAYRLLAARGFKSGGFSPTSTEVGGSDSLLNSPGSYEGGVKADLRGGRARLNVAAFHTHYTDLQVQTTIRPEVISSSRTPPKPRDPGSRRWKRRCGSARQCSLGGTWPCWIRSTIAYIAIGVGGVTGDVAGNKLNNSPEWSGRTWIDWTAIDRSIELVVASRRCHMENDGVLHAVQRHDPEAGSARVAGRQRPVWPGSTSAGRLGVYKRATLRMRTTSLAPATAPPPAIGGRPGAPRQVGVQLADWRRRHAPLPRLRARALADVRGLGCRAAGGPQCADPSLA